MNFTTEFIKDCELRHLSKRTIETYKSDINHFLSCYPNPSQVDQGDLKRYLIKLRAANLADSTLLSRFSAINTFYEFLIYENLCSTNPLPAFRKRFLPKKIQGEHRQLISVGDMRRLIQAVQEIRDRAIIVTLAKTGLRRGELLDLTINDIDFQKNIIHLPHKAKRTNRIMFMDRELQEVLREYLVWRDEYARTEWLWITPHGGRIHKDYAGHVIASIGQRLGLHEDHASLDKKLTPHCFRHFLTTELFRAGLDPEYIMWIRGDSLTRNAWEIYNHIDIEAVRVEYERCVPKLVSDRGHNMCLDAFLPCPVV